MVDQSGHDASVAHSHPLLMTPKVGTQLTLGVYHLRYLIALVKNFCGLQPE